MTTTTQPQAALLSEAAQNALTTLDGIANANPRDKADFETPAEWIAWAKSRARWAADALRAPVAQEIYAERILKQMLQAEKKCGTCGFIGQEDPIKGCPKCGFDDMRAMCQTTLLTRQEMLAAIRPLTDSNAGAEMILDISAEEYRAIEAAILAKLQATQEPVAWRVSVPDEPELGSWLSEEPGADYCRNEPLYTGRTAAQEATVKQSLTVEPVQAEELPDEREALLEFAKRGTGFDTCPTRLLPQSIEARQIDGWWLDYFTRADDSVRRSARAALSARKP